MISLNEQRSPIRSLALYREAAALARRPEEKRLLLGGIGKLGSTFCARRMVAPSSFCDRTVRERMLSARCRSSL